MSYDFDRHIDRCGTGCLKWDFAKRRGLPEDVLPLWVADMDFAAPSAVADALIAAATHGIFGYTDTLDDYYDTLQGWFARHFDWQLDPSWLVKTPGVVPALYFAVQAYTRPNEQVLIQSPVYYPFREAIADTGRKLVSNSLMYTDGHYEIDFADFEAKLADPATKLFILCSPHNPVGRVWTRKELQRMADLCLKHEVVIVSDEIHMDFVYPGHAHTVLATLGEEYAQNAVICTAPSKTFNIAGLQVANIFIPNERLRRLFRAVIQGAGLSQPNLMGVVACKAAYQGGEQWLAELLVYLQGNFSYLREFLRENLPAVELVEPEGTYLAWLDCRRLGLDHKGLEDLIVHRAKLWLDGGTMFGPEGAGFQRVNLACPRATLTEALTRLAAAF